MISPVTVREKSGACAFLGGLKVEGYNSFLLRAVTAWFRQESGSVSRVIGNNPFNIRPGVADALANGKRRGPVGYFLTFPDLNTGFAAAALVLTRLAPSYGYGLVIENARKRDALGFLAALAQSSWDAGHYGVRPGDNPRSKVNALVNVYSQIP